MKSNVDLTQGRMFSGAARGIPTNALFMKFESLFPGSGLGTLFPWSVDRFTHIKSDSELSSGSSDEIIFTGNASQRDRKRFNKQIDSGDMCDCCGADLTKKPWDRHYCLCSSCMDNLGDTVRKYWKYKDNDIDMSTDRIVIEMNYRGV